MVDMVKISKVELDALKEENERLKERVKVQEFNLRLRELDGSVDIDVLIKDAERWRIGVGLGWVDMKTVRRINDAMKGGE